MARPSAPATQYEYAAFLADRQHVGPRRWVKRVAGVRKVIAQLQGREFFQVIIEGDALPACVNGCRPSMLDELCSQGFLRWRRLEHILERQDHTPRRQRPAPPLGAHKFGGAASFRIWMSNAWSATKRFRRPFSFSNAFSCLATSGAIPPYF